MSMLFCVRVPNFVQIGYSAADFYDVISIFKMAAADAMNLLPVWF